MFDPLTTAEISSLFTSTIQPASGRMLESFDDGRRVFLRAVLPFVEAVRRDDHMEGGVALRATETQVSVHPFLFRQVCRNGAIVAQSLDSWSATFSEYDSAENVSRQLREAVTACCDPGIFAANVASVRSSLNHQVDIALTFSAFAAGHRGVISADTILQIVSQFFDSADQSRFALMNVVTATARETRDPEVRWRLEELGGSIGAGITPPQPADFDSCRMSTNDFVRV